MEQNHFTRRAFGVIAGSGGVQVVLYWLDPGELTGMGGGVAAMVPSRGFGVRLDA
jgi:hypothetical protein